MVRFLYKNQQRELEGVAPDLTILEYLRTKEVQRGTKEGCASGDCGACTVVVAEPSHESGKLLYKSVNSCITFVGSLHGKQLITVEDLKQGRQLHIAQQAMVDCHGSQCGFCTPGFVMSLFALQKNQLRERGERPSTPRKLDAQGERFSDVAQGEIPSTPRKLDAQGERFSGVAQGEIPSTPRQLGAQGVELFDPSVAATDTHDERHQIELALGGNLCRCTGYRPIIDAAATVPSHTDADQFDDHEADIWQQLMALRTNEASLASLSESPSRPGDVAGERHFFLPTSIDELVSLLVQYPQARLVAGGTDLALEYTQMLKPLDVLIATGSVAEMKTVSLTGDAASGRSLIIGGAVSLSDAIPHLQPLLPEFATMMERFAALQVRNQGTIAGNVANASPIGDTPPVLLALDAVLHVHSATGKSEIPINGFFTDYRQTTLPAGGVITAIEIPLDKTDWHRRVYKVSKRLEDDISAVLAAVMFNVKDGVIVDARLGFGGVAAVPLRVASAEQALIGQPPTLDGIKAAQAELANTLKPLTDVRASAEYRLHIARNLLTRAVLEYQQPQQHITLDAVAQSTQRQEVSAHA